MKNKTLYGLLFVAGLLLVLGGRQAGDVGHAGLPNPADSAIKAWFADHQLVAVGVGLTALLLALLGVFHERR